MGTLTFTAKKKNTCVKGLQIKNTALIIFVP